MSKDELYKLVLDYLDGNLDPLKLDILKHELEMMGYGLDNLEELKSLVKTAQFYKVLNPRLPDSLRIDAISVLLDKSKDTTNVEHMENVSS